MAVDGLAKLSCKHCRAKKLKCSRELPKCDKCRPWPGPCEYPEYRKPPKRKYSAIANSPLPSINDHVPLDSSAGDSIVDRAVLGVDNVSTETLQPFDVLPAAIVGTGDFPAMDALAYAPTMRLLTELRQNFGSTVDPQRTSLDGASFGSEADGSSAKESLFIPPSNIREQLIDDFITALHGSALFFPPIDETILRRVMSQPQSLAQPGWVVIFYCIVAGAWHRRDATSPTCLLLHQNFELASKDPRLFLNPCEENLRALCLRVSHFRKYVTPLFSKSIVTQAANMILYLGIHMKPTDKEILRMGDFAWRQRQVLFWSVYILDHTLSLTFGRPPMITIDNDFNLPMPDIALFEGFLPHLSSDIAARLRGQLTLNDVYGRNPQSLDVQRARFALGFPAWHAYFKTQLALLMNRIAVIDKEGVFGTLEDAALRTQVLRLLEELQNDVQAAYTNFHQVCPPNESDYIRFGISGFRNTWPEMQLGLEFLCFQIAHAKVLVAYNHRSKTGSNGVAVFETLHESAVNAARQAMFHTRNMVWSEYSVFNGVAWQLLYQPFTSFFVLVHEVRARPNFNDTINVECIKVLPRYLKELSKEYEEAKNLKDLAESFVRALQEDRQREIFRRTVSQATYLTSLSGMNFDLSSQLDMQGFIDAIVQHSNIAMPTFWYACAFDDRSLVDGDDGAQAYQRRLAMRVNPFFDWFSGEFSSAVE